MIQEDSVLICDELTPVSVWEMGLLAVSLCDAMQSWNGVTLLNLLLSRCQELQFATMPGCVRPVGDTPIDVGGRDVIVDGTRPLELAPVHRVAVLDSLLLGAVATGSSCPSSGYGSMKMQ